MTSDGQSIRIALDQSSAQLDFFELWCHDNEHGVARSLAEYLARYPGHECAIARAYLECADTSDALRAIPPAPAGSDASDTGKPALPLDERASNALIERLRARPVGPLRYSMIGELARGGMGIVVQVRDEDLRRELAMKVMRGRTPRRLARFLEEAQVTGRLEHPSIVPVHDVGVSADGRAYYTMRLVRGRDLRLILALVERGHEGWTTSRALEVLLKVCDALAYAHSRQVLHRDLKPANVMVGEFGEVYVVDWGLASAERTRAGATDDAQERDDELAVETLDGDVLGTPSYMSPEQAFGRVRELDARSDVYSVGAILYELLTGVPPYVRPGERARPFEIVERVRSGPPSPVHALRPTAPVELSAICERAMARDPAARYADARSLADDLRAYLDLRTVRAYKTGAGAELSKWVQRNRKLALSIALAAVVALATLLGFLWLERESRARLQLLADSRGPESLASRADAIGAPTPDNVPAMERWLSEAEALVSQRERYARELRAIEARALPYVPDSPREREAARALDRRLRDFEAVIEHYEREYDRIWLVGGRSDEGFLPDRVALQLRSLVDGYVQETARRTGPLSKSFADPRDELRYDTLVELLPELDRLAGDGETEGAIERMRRRVEFARTVEQKTLAGAAARAWSAAIASIADRERCPQYEGLVLEPQLGMIPIRRDPRSGLWEFLHLQSGAMPEVGPDDAYRIRAETGIVLVLVPGGVFRMGAQRGDVGAPNFDEHAQPEESALESGGRAAVERILSPFFVAKYEMTQAQWLRCAGTRPSTHGDLEDSPLHPVESMSWTDADRALRDVGLALPTEAQWEFAARAGTETPWWKGCDASSLADAAVLREGGHASTRPIGPRRPNAFGLHDVCGNVAEWCRDHRESSYDSEKKLHTGERTGPVSVVRVRRGGGYDSPAVDARSAARALGALDRRAPDVGVRPARDLFP